MPNGPDETTLPFDTATPITRRDGLQTIGASVVGFSLLSACGGAGSSSRDPVTPTPTPTPTPPPLASPLSVAQGISGLVSYWDFTEATGQPRLNKSGGPQFTLIDNDGSAVAQVSDNGPLSGFAASFNGTTDGMHVPFDQCGPLNFGQLGDNAVSVLAWVKVTNPLGYYIAGVWQEGGVPTKRQYALYTNLALYGGGSRIMGQVDLSGGPTPGYPYSRDFSSPPAEMARGRWTFAAFTYDGTNSTCYQDARFEPWASYTDVQGETYSKNPYLYTNGLNPNPTRFDCGASLQSSDTSSAGQTVNPFRGEIGGVIVYSRALTQEELMQLHLVTRPYAEPIHLFDFPTSVIVTTGASGHGWKALVGPAGRDISLGENSLHGLFSLVLDGTEQYMGRFVNATNNDLGIGYFEGLVGLQSDHITTISFDLNNGSALDQFKFCVRIGTTWYATAQNFAMMTGQPSGMDWSKAETKTFTFSRTAANWLTLDIQPGVALTVGSALSADMPVGELTGLGMYATAAPQDQCRIRNISVFRG